MKFLKILKVVVLIFSFLWLFIGFANLIGEGSSGLPPSIYERFVEFTLLISFSVLSIAYVLSINLWNHRHKKNIGIAMLFLAMTMLAFFLTSTMKLIPVIFFLSILSPQILYLFLTKFWENV